MTDFLHKYLVQSKTEDHDHPEDEGDPIVAKSVAMVVLFLASFTLGTIPLKLSKWFNWENNPRNNKIVVMLLCFGGGALLCTTFLHMLPEVKEGLEALTEEGVFPELKFPMAELLMCIGFFTMFFVEECVHSYLDKREQKNALSPLRRSLSVRRGETITASGEPFNNLSTADLVHNLEEGAHQEKNFTPNLGDNANLTHIPGHAHGHGHSHAGHSHVIIEDSVVKSIRGLLIVLALSVHELFEGLSVGLEHSVGNVWYMFGAVSAHKLVIAFCIGVELISAKTKVSLMVFYVFVFAIVSPLGIGIGIAISGHENHDSQVASVILQGLASGTLLYVVFFEILQNDRKGGLQNYASILVGFAIMFGLTLLGEFDPSFTFCPVISYILSVILFTKSIYIHLYFINIEYLTHETNLMRRLCLVFFKFSKLE